MNTVTYISDPDIALDHLNEVVARVLQYQIFYPTTPKLLDFEAQYNEYLDADLITISSTPVFEMADDENLDEPACGDCGGCCECLGDPPDCRWDTTAERDDEYMEIYEL